MRTAGRLIRPCEAWQAGVVTNERGFRACGVSVRLNIVGVWALPLSWRWHAAKTAAV
jgi:hypothetical protein